MIICLVLNFISLTYLDIVQGRISWTPADFMAQNVDDASHIVNKLEEKDILIISNVFKNTTAAQAEGLLQLINQT